MSNAAEPQWEQSVEKARLALVKTFEGRVEAALASFEQIPGGSGRKKNGEQTLAQFALDAGVRFNALTDYRMVTKWLSERSASADHSDALDVARGIGSYSTAREAMRSKKWKSGKTFASYILANDPPEPFTKWTLDALRIHLNLAPTNTGAKALALAAGEKVTEDDLHGAAAMDHAEEVVEEIGLIESKLTAAVVAADASDMVLAAAPETGKTIKELDLEALSLLGDIANTVGKLEAQLGQVDEWRARYGRKDFDGETGEELMHDSLTEKKGRLDIAFSKTGVGEDIESGFAALLDKE